MAQDRRFSPFSDNLKEKSRFAGVGAIGIADGGRVELSKLRRQILHGAGDTGRLKADSARDSFMRRLSDKKCLLFIGKKYETAHNARISDESISSEISIIFLPEPMQNQPDGRMAFSKAKIFLIIPAS